MDNDGSNSMKFVVLGIAAVVLLVAGGVAWMVFGKEDTASIEDSHSSTEADHDHATETADVNTDEVVAADTVMIVYTDDGFDKKVYGIQSGGTVTVKNNSSGDLQFSSGEHPTHHENEELNLDVLAAGQSTTFTPEEKGTWGVHDHFHDDMTTTLVVK